MADKAKPKESTPPPLLLMPASEGLTFSSVAPANILMPVPQTEASLFGGEEEGEVDSFIGQSPPSVQAFPPTTSGTSPNNLFQPQPQLGTASDPFAHIRQPAPSRTPTPPQGLSHLPQGPTPPSTSWGPSGGHFNSNQPAVRPPFGPGSVPFQAGIPQTSQFPGGPPLDPTAGMSVSQPGSGITGFPLGGPSPAGPPLGGPPQSGLPPPKGATPNFHRLSGRPQYAPPPPGTYAPGPTHVGDAPPSTLGSMSPPLGAPPSASSHVMTLPGGSDFSTPPPPTTSGTLPPISGDFAPPHQPLMMGRAPGPPAVMEGLYLPLQHHWFYSRNVELRQTWKPFSIADSIKLEEAFHSGAQDNVIVSTDGGRYDVDVVERSRTAVYWEESPTRVRRGSWFYRPEGDTRFVPFEEDTAVKLEEEYKRAIQTNEWHKRQELPSGEVVVMHNPGVIVSFSPSAQPDEWGTSQGSDQIRPRVVKRGVEDFENIADGEPTQIDHVMFVVHGIGPTCDLRFRNIIECVDDFRDMSLQMMKSHFRLYQDEGRVGRVEFLPVRWHQALHGDATGVDRRLKAITLSSIGKLRHFTNDTLLDILFYASPTYAQQIADTVGSEINRLYNLFCSRNPGFHGNASLVGHSLGSLILFDMLSHQQDGAGTEDLSTDTSGLLDSSSASTVTNGSTRASTPSAELNGDVTQVEREDVPTLEQLLTSLSLSDHLDTFRKEQIDVEALLLCDESDLKEMGVPLGPRKKLHGFVKDHRQKQIKKEDEQMRQAEAAQQQQQQQQQAAQDATCSGDDSASRYSLLRSASNTSVDYVVGVAGTGIPFVKYPKLDFQPVNFFALGSPIAMFLTVRGVECLGEEFKFPSCGGFFNIFHPFDPVAYRLEPMITSSYPAKPYLVPHHKGRKRLHLELRESLTRVGSDLKNKMVEYFKSTWRTINDFAASHRNSPQDMEKEVDNVLSQMTKAEEENFETGSIASSLPEEEVMVGTVNQGRRIDYVLQEKPIESFNDYLFAVGSHMCYWESEDTVLLMLKETYGLMGLAPQRPSLPPHAFPRHPLAGPGLGMATSPSGVATYPFNTSPPGMAPAPFTTSPPGAMGAQRFKTSPPGAFPRGPPPSMSPPGAFPPPGHAPPQVGGPPPRGMHPQVAPPPTSGFTAPPLSGFVRK